MSMRASCRTSFKNNKILTVYGIFIQECILFFVKHRDLFEQFRPQSGYPSRNCTYYYPKHRLKQTESGGHYNCIKMYNFLPRYIKEISSMPVFKKKLFKYLCNLEPYNIHDYICKNVVDG